MLRTISIERIAVVRRWLPTDAYVWLKALLLVGISVQLAQLAWALVTPVGPLGEWRPPVARRLSAVAQDAIIATVNPFFRDGAATTLQAAAPPDDLKLFGVRDNVATGGGGAIIGMADGQQVSVGIGEQVAPGIVLAEVGFDFAVVERGGVRQKIFLDQDKPAETVAAGAGVSAAPPSAGISAASLRAGISATPRVSGASVNGILVSPAGDGTAFASAGFRPGDIITAINGANIASATDAAQLQSSLVPGATLSLTIERAGQAVPLSLKIPDSQ